MNYRSVAQLSNQIWEWSQRLPHVFDLVVGVPRSGLLAANLFALYRNVPFTDLESFLVGRVIAAGERMSEQVPSHARQEQLRVLVLDDSIYSGGAMRRAREKIDAAALPHEIHYGAVYVLPGTEHLVDHYCEVVEAMRVFEWNVMHRRLDRACMSLDGVLYPAPSADGRGFQNAFLSDATPLFVPQGEVRWLITCRTEKDRASIEDWLGRWGIRYGELVMAGDAGHHSREGETCSLFKAEVYRRTGAAIYFEGFLDQAMQIANLSLRHVLCTGTMQMVYPHSVPCDRFALASRSSLLSRQRDGLRVATTRIRSMLGV